jgi:DNA-binding transcriptional LysR family regulator
MAASLAELMPIVIRELPFELPALPVSQVWHPKDDGDAASEWFRAAVARAFRAASVEDTAPGPAPHEGPGVHPGT